MLVCVATQTGVHCRLKLSFAKEDKLNGNCQGKLLDCFYIRDYGVDSVAIRLSVYALPDS